MLEGEEAEEGVGGGSSGVFGREGGRFYKV